MPLTPALAPAARRARPRRSGRRAPSPRRTRRRTCTRTSRSPPRRPARAPRRTVRTPRASRGSPLRVAEVEHGEECLLRHLDRADLLHPLLAGLLLLEQLALARDVAAVALRDHVLAPRLHRLARDHPGADRGLDRDVEPLPRDLLAQLLDEQPASVVREVAVDDQRERVDRLLRDQHVDADELARKEPGKVVVEARVPARARLE